MNAEYFQNVNILFDFNKIIMDEILQNPLGFIKQKNNCNYTLLFQCVYNLYKKGDLLKKNQNNEKPFAQMYRKALKFHGSLDISLSTVFLGCVLPLHTEDYK